MEIVLVSPARVQYKVKRFCREEKVTDLLLLLLSPSEAFETCNPEMLSVFPSPDLKSSVRNFHVLVDNVHFSAVLDIHKRDHRPSCLIKTKETFGKRKESQRLTNKVPVETPLLWERIELQ